MQVIFAVLFSITIYINFSQHIRLSTKLDSTYDLYQMKSNNSLIIRQQFAKNPSIY